MKRIFILFFLVLSAFEGRASASKAMAAYTRGDYAESLRLWNAELKTPSAYRAGICFQIGNCLEKLGDHSQAILFYERSLKEDYNDESVKFNIKVARAKLGLDTDNKILFVHDWIKKAAYVFSSSGFQWMIGGLCWAILVVSILQRFRPFNGIESLLKIGMGLLLICAVLYGMRSSFQAEESYAIITGTEVIGYQQVTMKGAGKPLREGEKIKILDQVDQNIQVQSETDSSYWIRASEIKII